MKTELLTIDPVTDPGGLTKRAADALRDGQLVVFPTETVYGLAANAGHPATFERLRAVKGAASRTPWTFHVARRGEIDRFAPNLSPVGRRLCEKGWPGPVTLVVRLDDPSQAPVWGELSAETASAIYADRSVWLRCPDDPVASSLLAACTVPIVATSANVVGRAPATTGDEAFEQLNGLVDLVIDAGRTRYGKPSTIVSINGDGFTVLRVGVFDERTIRRLATLNILFVCSGNTCRSPMAEALARTMIADRLNCRPEDLTARGVQLSSAGTHSFGGAPASPEAVEVCQLRGAALQWHRSRHLTRDMVESADHIFAMTDDHIHSIRALAPEAARKTARLDPLQDVSDPLGGSIDEYAACADRIAAALRIRLNEVIS